MLTKNRGIADGGSGHQDVPRSVMHMWAFPENAAVAVLLTCEVVFAPHSGSIWSIQIDWGIAVDSILQSNDVFLGDAAIIIKIGNDVFIKGYNPIHDAS